jgi:uncharacterized phage infection (PIP) family protein YhgE
MQLINAGLIFLAILLMWSTLNLERPSSINTTNEQSTQLNDSMEFLRKLKGKSAKEESQTKRIEAYRQTVELSLQDNPDSINEIDVKFDKGSQDCDNLLNQIISSSQTIDNDIFEINQSVEKIRTKESNDSSETITHLRDILDVINQLESSSSEVESYSRGLSKRISEVKAGVIY